MSSPDPESALTPDVAHVSELGFTLVEELLARVVRTDARTSRDEAVRNLTICGMTLSTRLRCSVADVVSRSRSAARAGRHITLV
jgi:hypothetical protein